MKDVPTLAAMNGQLIRDEGHRNPMVFAQLASTSPCCSRNPGDRPNTYASSSIDLRISAELLAELGKAFSADQLLTEPSFAEGIRPGMIPFVKHFSVRSERKRSRQSVVYLGPSRLTRQRRPHKRLTGTSGKSNDSGRCTYTVVPKGK